ncbi:hypothetical protein MCOR14_005221 [Pyricularia oryzae]|nr:hypothetical protein MCOR14_005221 [Pyricularia oryzae]
MSPPTSTLFKHQPLPIFSIPRPRKSHAASGPGTGTEKPRANPTTTWEHIAGVGATSITVSADYAALGTTSGVIGSRSSSSGAAKGIKGGAGRTRRKEGSDCSHRQPARTRERKANTRKSGKRVDKRKTSTTTGATLCTNTRLPVPVPVPVPAPTPTPTPSPDLLPVRLFVLARAHRYAADPAAAPQTLEQAVSEFVSFFPVDIAISDILTDEVLEVLNQLVRRREVSSGGPGGAGDSTPTLPLIRDTLVEQFREDRFAHRRELERRARPDTYTPYRQCMCRVLPLPCWRCGYGSSHHEGV